MSGPTSYDCPGIPADMLIAQLRSEVAALKAQLAEAEKLVACAVTLNMGRGIYIGRTSDGGYYLEWGARFDQREGFHTLAEAIAKARTLAKEKP